MKLICLTLAACVALAAGAMAPAPAPIGAEALVRSQRSPPCRRGGWLPLLAVVSSGKKLGSSWPAGGDPCGQPMLTQMELAAKLCSKVRMPCFHTAQRQDKRADDMHDLRVTANANWSMLLSGWEQIKAFCTPAVTAM